MTQNVNATLKIKPGYNGGVGWSDATASNGQPYSYKYGGGSDDLGDLDTTINTGVASLQLTLDTDRQRYALGGASFANDGAHQLSWTQTDSATGTIIDANTAVETAKYTVQVTDTTSGASIPCDPMIFNRPTPP